MIVNGFIVEHSGLEPLTCLLTYNRIPAGPRPRAMRGGYGSVAGGTRGTPRRQVRSMLSAAGDTGGGISSAG